MTPPIGTRSSAGSYALASQVQKLRVAPETLSVSIPAATLWGLADRSYANTDRQSVRRYAPAACYEEWQGIGHFIDIEAPEKIAEVADRLLAA